MINFLFPQNVDQADLKKAIEIKSKHIPQYVYKYRSITKHSLDNLKNDTIRCSKASEFNDPYDSAISFLFSSSNLGGMYRESFKDISFNCLRPFMDVENMKSADNPMDEIISNISSIISEKYRFQVTEKIKAFETLFGKTISRGANDTIQNSVKICCFSRSKNSFPMWAHYSNNHKGFAIQYEFAQSDFQDNIWPVLYNDDLLDISRSINRSLNCAKRFNPNIGIYAAINKNIDWAYEKEWRFICNTGANQPSFSHTVLTPTAIYIGAKFDFNAGTELFQICDKKEIPMFQMELDQSSYTLKPKKL